VRNVVANAPQLLLDNVEYRFLPVRDGFFDVRNIFHDDELGPQQPGYPKKLDKERVAGVRRVTSVLDADGEALARGAAEQNVGSKSSERVRDVFIRQGLNVSPHDARARMVGRESLGRPFINFKRADYVAASQFEPEAKPTGTSKRVQNSQSANLNLTLIGICSCAQRVLGAAQVRENQRSASPATS